ncbi:MAG TPA: ATPase, T2SS/T4P/T4SS family, partial [Gemmatimonadales bacterium]
MARIDQLIRVLHEQRGDSLQLVVGKPAVLVRDGTTRSLTKDPLTDAQIAALLREIAPAEAATRVGSTAGVDFEYRAPSGSVQVESRVAEAMLRPLAAPVAKPAGPSEAELKELRAAIDVLFRRLVESGASDLHLRTGEPPLLRHDGELVRLPGDALPPDRLDGMLISIMEAKELGEYRELNDTDWAYEIEGLARFRCNAGRDRRGPMAVFRTIPGRVLSADEMGLSREVQNLCYLTKGLVLVTGPTGSGKSTTLA